jgi:hypothetical protein
VVENHRPSWRAQRTVPPGFDSSKPPSDPANVRALREAFVEKKGELPLTTAMSAGFYFGSIRRHRHGFDDSVFNAVFFGDTATPDDASD